MYTTSERIELESPGCSGFEANQNTFPTIVYFLIFHQFQSMHFLFWPQLQQCGQCVQCGQLYTVFESKKLAHINPIGALHIRLLPTAIVVDVSASLTLHNLWSWTNLAAVIALGLSCEYIAVLLVMVCTYLSLVNFAIVAPSLYHPEAPTEVQVLWQKSCQRPYFFDKFIKVSTSILFLTSFYFSL